MNQKKHLAKNTILIAVSKISTNAITFLMLPLYTAILTTSEYGTVDLITTYVALFAPLVLLNMEMAVFRHLVDARDDRLRKNSIITNAIEIIVCSSFLAILLFSIANIFFTIPMANTLVFYFFSISFSSAIIQIIRGLGNTKLYAIVSIAQGLLGVVLSFVALVGLEMGPQGLLLGLAFGAIIPTVVAAIISGIPKCIKLQARSRIVKRELIKYSLPLIPNSISWWVFTASDRTIVSAVIGVAANGIYAVSTKFSTVLSSLWGIFYMSWSESAAININRKNRDKFFSDIANVALKCFGALALIGTAITPLAFPVLTSAAYGEALLYVPVLMFASLLNAVIGFYSAIYIAKKLTKQVMNTSVVAAIINIVVNLALINFIGLWAAAISTAVAYGIMAIYRHYDMKKYVKITYEKGIFVKVIGLFVAVSALYYLNTIWANIAALIIAIISSIILNRNLLKSSLKFTKKKLSRK